MIFFIRDHNRLKIIKGFHRGGFIFLALGLLAFSSFAAEIKRDPLPRRIEQLLEMHKKASEKLILAQEMLEQLNQRRDELREEILEMQQQEKIVAFAKAVQLARIKFDLLLLGQIEAYGTELDLKIEKLKEARARLDFLYQMTEDDLKIIETLDHLDSSGTAKTDRPNHTGL
jgi:hypothetical protein